MRLFPVLAAALLATAANAQAPVAQAPTAMPGTPDPRAITAGTYKVEPQHTQVTFAVDHMGFSIFRGQLGGASGSLTLDPANPAKTALSVTIPTNTIHTTVDKLTGELVQPDWLDSAKYPQASFVSTKVTPGPDNKARIDGNLTLHGVTKPAMMIVSFRGAGTNPYSKILTIGFDGRMTIKRSDFGVTKLLDLVSDTVQITVAGAFEKVG